MRFSLFCTILLFSSALQAQTPSRDFHFSPPDEKLLEDANQLDKRFEEKGLLYNDVEAESYLKEIGDRLLAGSRPPERVTYRFRILRDPMVNAFALPNGSIYVNTGLVAALENEAELASVVGHEITHVTDRHPYELNRNIRKKVVTMEVIGAVGGAAGNVGSLGGLFAASMVAAAEVSQVIIISTVYGYSRDLERDADTSGYRRLTQANYDGASMKRSLQILDEKLEFEPAQPFWHTHPKLEERIATATELAKGGSPQQPRAATEDDYLEHMAAVIRYNTTLDLDSRRARTAIARMERLVKWRPNDAANRTLLADAYRSLGAKTPLPDEKEFSDSGKDTMRKRAVKLTAEEEEKALLKTRAGQATLQSNRDTAESLYREAIALDVKSPAPHRGLGMLYQDEAKTADASREYQIYLDLASPEALDRLRIERRIEALKTPAEGAKK